MRRAWSPVGEGRRWSQVVTFLRFASFSGDPTCWFFFWFPFTKKGGVAPKKDRPMLIQMNQRLKTRPARLLAASLAAAGQCTGGAQGKGTTSLGPWGMRSRILRGTSHTPQLCSVEGLSLVQGSNFPECEAGEGNQRA